jgi:hypothetical protein
VKSRNDKADQGKINQIKENFRVMRRRLCSFRCKKSDVKGVFSAAWRQLSAMEEPKRRSVDSGASRSVKG